MNKASYNPDVLTCLANLSNDEVFTPPRIANAMLDILPTHLWSNPQAKFLDPFCKSGIFLREIAKRLMKGLATHIPNQQERINHILGTQLYGIAITELTALLTRRSVYCSKHANNPQHSLCKTFTTSQGNIAYTPTAHTWKNGKCIYCGASQKTLGTEQRAERETHAYQFIHHQNPFTDMKFDVIIGNPPYQLSDGGAGASASPIYHYFIAQAKKLNPHYLCMIVPSRWFAGGKGLDDFRDEMLSDDRLKEIHDYPTASEVFPGVEIKGGVNYFLWQSNYKGDCLVKTYQDGKSISEMKRPLKEKNTNTLIRFNEAIPILRKVQQKGEKSFAELVSSRKPFGIPTNTKGQSSPFVGSIRLYQNGGIGYISLHEITKNQQWVAEHKVFVPYAIGSADMKTDLVNPIYAEPNTACTETYLAIGPFLNEQQCKNVISYIRTKFFHFMLGLKKITQHTTHGTYSFVPLQDFSESWTDEKLYAKYGLTEDEISFIENMVREMP